MPVDLQVDIEDREWVDVRRCEGMDLVAAFLSRAISSKDLVIEVDNDFRNHERTCDHEGTQQVIHCVTSELTNWNLRARHNYCLSEILEHETERRSSISKRISSVADHKAVIVLVMRFNCLSNLHLKLDPNVAGVY